MPWSRTVSRHGLAVLVVTAAILPLAILGATRVKVNWNLADYLPPEAPSVVGLTILDDEFQDASISFLIVENKSTAAVIKLKAAIEGVPGVADVIGADDILDPALPREMLPDELRKGFYSERGTLLVIRFLDGAESTRTIGAVEGIRRLLDRDCYLAGAAAQKIDTRDLSQNEIVLTLVLAIAFVALILGLTMESWLIPVIFLVEIGVAIICNFGSNVFLGSISFLTQSLASVLQLGVTMDFSIFLLHRYDEERLLHADRRDAMTAAIDKTFLNVLGSALTDVAGFMALCAMQLGFGLDIGIVMSKGVLIGLLVTLTVLPALILVLDRPIHFLSHRALMFGFRGMSRASTRRPLLVLALALVLFPPAYWGSRHVRQDYDMTGGPPATLPSLVAAAKLKSDFNMQSTHYIIMRDGLAQNATRTFLGRLDGVAGVSSVIALEKYVGGLIPAEFLPEGIRSIFRAGGRSLVIVTSVFEVGTEAEMAQVDALTDITREYDPEGIVTGEGALAKDLVEIAATDFRRVDAVSIAGIALIVLLVFGSVSMPLVLVGAIELAIMVNLALPYYVGGEVSFVSTIVIGCIQLGCTIDYSILLVSRFREDLQSRVPSSGDTRASRALAREAMVEALSKSAPSILTSGLILGFSTASIALVSNLALLRSICTLISRGAFVSVAVVLFVLPSILIVAEPFLRRTTRRWPGRAGRVRSPRPRRS